MIILKEPDDESSNIRNGLLHIWVNIYTFVSKLGNFLTLIFALILQHFTSEFPSIWGKKMSLHPFSYFCTPPVLYDYFKHFFLSLFSFYHLSFLAIISFLLRKSWIETFLQTCSKIVSLHWERIQIKMTMFFPTVEIGSIHNLPSS